MKILAAIGFVISLLVFTAMMLAVTFRDDTPENR